MSVFEELEELKERVKARLSELEPLIKEYRDLQQVAERLQIELPSAPESAEALSPQPVPGKAGARASKSPATRATRKPRSRASKPAAKQAPARKRAASKSSDRRSRPGGTRAIGQDRRERILELIRSRPGITVPEISRELGVEPPPLYRVVRKLSADGVVKKEGKSLELVS